MVLHHDRDAMRAILSDISQKTGIRGDIIEKDYYLTLLLWELFHRQKNLPAYFKGGTALYKAIGRMKRFSEDIDLTVEIRDCSKSQGKKRLETAANAYTELRRTAEKERESNQRGSITSVYEYDPVVAVDEDDALQRFGYVKVEATSFTVSEPTETLTVSPLLYSEATEEQRSILEASVESVGWSAVRESGMKIGAGEHNHSEKVIHVAKAKSGTDDEFDFVVDGLGAGIRKAESGGSNNGVKVAFDFLAQLAEHGDPAPLGPGHPLGERTGDLIRPGLESQTKILFEQVGTVELRIGPGQELQLGLLIFREMLRVFEQDIA